MIIIDNEIFLLNWLNRKCYADLFGQRNVGQLQRLQRVRAFDEYDDQHGCGDERLHDHHLLLRIRHIHRGPGPGHLCLHSFQVSVLLSLSLIFMSSYSPTLG